MKTKYFARFALTCAAVFALGTMTSCGDEGGEEPAVPVVTITTQPTAPAGLVEGSITGSLTVVATVTEGATLTYQWYSNTTASNEGGTTISGATSASYTLPTTLTAGTYYYFCEVGAKGAESKRTNAVTVTVTVESVGLVVTITITTQPTVNIVGIEGLIPEGTKLTVEATATEGATLTYQWYSNTTASNTGGTAISGATTANYTLATDLPKGKYYYYCVVGAEGAENKPSNVATLMVMAVTPGNSRITWKEGKYAITTDETDGGLFFKFGGVVGIFTGNGAVLTLPSNAQDGFDVGDIAWNPTGATTWTGIPAYDDYPANVDAAYHTAANVKAGKGDPCRLVGLDLNKIATTAAASLTSADVDNGQWRMPTDAENVSFVAAFQSYSWGMLRGVGGVMLFKTTDNEATFLPATGYRYVADGSFNGAGSYGTYWSGTPVVDTAYGYGLDFSAAGGLSTSYGYNGRNTGFAVRCVRQ